MKITQLSRMGHHTLITAGSFTIPPSEDFTDGSWTVNDLALSEFGVQEVDNELFIRIGANIEQIQFVGGPLVGVMYEPGTAGTDSIKTVGGTNDATGNYSVVSGGNSNDATADYSFLGGGQFCNALSSYSFVGGGNSNTVTSTFGGVVGGFTNIIAIGADYAFIGGGQENTASATHSVVVGGGGVGVGNTASGNNSFVGGGETNNTSADFSFIGGGGNNTIDGSLGQVIVGGISNDVYGDYSIIVGGLSNIIGTQFTADSGRSFIGGGDTNSIITTGDFSSIVCGVSNLIDGTGDYHFIGGGFNNTISSGTRNVISGGYENIITGNNSAIGGGFQNTVSGDNSSIQGGAFAIADRDTMRAYAGAQFGGTPGSAQQVDFVLSNSTTNTTATNVFLDGGSARLTINSGSSLACTVNVSGIEDDGNEAAHYIRKVMIKNVGGTTSLVGAVQTIGTDVETSAGLNVTITADNTNDALDIKVTGLAATNMRWVSHVSGVEIIY